MNPFLMMINASCEAPLRLTLSHERSCSRPPSHRLRPEPPYIYIYIFFILLFFFPFLLAIDYHRDKIKACSITPIMKKFYISFLVEDSIDFHHFFFQGKRDGMVAVVRMVDQ